MGIMLAGDGEYFGDRIFDCSLDLLPAFVRSGKMSKKKREKKLPPKLLPDQWRT